MPVASGSWFASAALLPGGLAADVRFEVVDGRFAAITPGGSAVGATRLPGVVLPGFANAHSHAFHRALRGRTHAGGGTFWTWREQMYALAATLDPDRYLALARATYAEMVLSGITAVGEFHYLHHAPGGRPYAEPNVMGEALRAAAADAGLRITLLDACYLAGGLDADGYRAPDEIQRRFSDGDADTWASRVAQQRPVTDSEQLGVAIHSVRAVPPDAMPTVAAAGAGRPLHVHLSEQPAENQAVEAVFSYSPTELLRRRGALDDNTTAVHASHLTESDQEILSVAGVTVCMCPTTERDLADGPGHARTLSAAGVPLSLGTDQHVQLDFFEEARGLEMDERLVSGERGRFRHGELVRAMTNHASLGWDDAGGFAVGQRVDLVAIRLDTPRMAGCPADGVVFAAGAGDVHTVVVGGETVVEDGRHRLGDVGALLTEAIEAAWRP